MTPGPVPSVFKEGWLRLNKTIPFLRGADGVVGHFKQNKERYAGLLGGYATYYKPLRPRLLTGLVPWGTPPYEGPVAQRSRTLATPLLRYKGWLRH